MSQSAKLNDQSQQYTSESVLKLISENDYLNKKMKDINSKIEGLDSKFKEIQDFNLECLVTKKFFNCLSCGSKKINYLPLNQIVMGDNGRTYKGNPHSRDPKMFINHSNVNSGSIFNPKFRDKKASANVFNLEFGNRQNNKENAYVSGQHIFDRDLGQKQHYVKRHLPLEASNQKPKKYFKSKDPKRISIKRKRPMTAVGRVN